MSNNPSTELERATPTPNYIQYLPTETLLIIIGYLHRLDLMKFAATCKYYKSLVNDNFPTTPTLDFHHLHCGKNNHWYIMKHAEDGTFTRIPAAVTRLFAKWKFVRFDESKFTLKDYANLYRFLEPISHLWKNWELTICAQSEVTEEFLQVVTTSKKLRVEINGVLAYLPQFFPEVPET